MLFLSIGMLPYRKHGAWVEQALTAPAPSAVEALADILKLDRLGVEGAVVLARRPELVQWLDNSQIMTALAHQRPVAIIALLRALRLQGGDAWDKGLETRFQFLTQTLLAFGDPMNIHSSTLHWAALEVPDLVRDMGGSTDAQLYAKGLSSEVAGTLWGVIFRRIATGAAVRTLEQLRDDLLGTMDTVAIGDALWLVSRQPDAASVLFDSRLKEAFVRRLAKASRNVHGGLYRAWINKSTLGNMLRVERIMGPPVGDLRDQAIILAAEEDPGTLLEELEKNPNVSLSEETRHEIMDRMVHHQDGAIRRGAMLIVASLSGGEAAEDVQHLAPGLGEGVRR